MNIGRVILNFFQFNQTNGKAILLCFLAATIFWVFSAFNKTHTTTVRFPLRFEFDDGKFVASQPLPHDIRINVTGIGWELFRKTLGIRLPELLIPLERPLEVKKIVTSSLTPVLASQLGGLQINYIVTDTLHIQLDNKKSKTFRLSVDVSNVLFREGFGYTGQAEIKPDSVVIDGPRSIINAIPDTIKLSVQGKQINKSFQSELEVIVKGSESVNRNPPVISVMVEVGPIEIVDTMIRVKSINQSRTWETTFASEVKVRIGIPASQRVDVNEKLARAYALIDLTAVSKGTHSIYPAVIGLPATARVVSVDSVLLKIN